MNIYITEHLCNTDFVCCHCCTVSMQQTLFAVIVAQSQCNEGHWTTCCQLESVGSGSCVVTNEVFVLMTLHFNDESARKVTGNSKAYHKS